MVAERVVVVTSPARVVPHPAAPPAGPFLTAEQLAAHLAVSTRQVRRWTAAGMPCERWGKATVRYQAAQAIMWLRNHTEET